jgi:choline dehydrogenase-like flavoprotein
VAEKFEVIIVGTGAGGGTLAHTLAPSGKRITLLEASHGRQFPGVRGQATSPGEGGSQQAVSQGVARASDW